MNKKYRMGISLSEIERKALLVLAEIDGGLSQSAEVRRLIQQAAKQKGVWDDLRNHLCTMPSKAFENKPI